MSLIQPIKILLWDGNETDDLVGQRTFEGIDEEIALKPTDVDVFTNTSWSTDADGYDSWNIRALIPASSISAGGNAVRLKIRASTTGGTVLTSVYVGHKAAAGNPYNFDGSQVPVLFGGEGSKTLLGGELVVSDAVLFDLDDTKDLIVSFGMTPVTNYIVLKDGLSSHAWYYNAGNYLQAGSTAPSGSYSNVAGRISTVEIVNDYEYPASGPSSDEEWKVLPIGSTIDMSTWRVPELMNDGDAGSINYHYALNGGASGSWLTQADMQSEGILTITDATQSIKGGMKALSNYLQKPTCQAYAIVDVTLPEGGGGGSALGRGLY